MRTLLLSAAAGTALAAAAPYVYAAVTPAQSAGLPAALDPIAIARSLCAPSTSGRWASRRAAFVAAASAYAQETADAEAEAFPPLWEGLGASTLPITSRSALAKLYFDQGLRLMHGFNHAEAVASFRAAQDYDSECALCLWGEALALGPNINAPMDPADYPRAFEAAYEAVRVAEAHGSDFEKALTQALTYRYEETAPDDRAMLYEAVFT